MKDFQTHNQQIQQLRKKGLVITNSSKVKRLLESDNYYTIVNGYRELFAASTTPFRFLPGTGFMEIYSLYDLDRELRGIYLKYLLKIEKTLQTLSSYYFSKENKRNNRAYLDFRKFRVPTPASGFPQASDIHKTISMFSTKMANTHDTAIQHYITKHQEVPFWVLANSLTMGDIGYVYYFMMDAQRRELAQHLTNLRRTEYRDKTIKVTEHDIDIMLFFGKFFRNSCAHNERFFCKGTQKIQNIKILLDKSKDFLTKRDFLSFSNSIHRLFDDYAPKFITISISSIRRKAGF
jgi:abortive infection bacteriophage resistance protein